MLLRTPTRVPRAAPAVKATTGGAQRRARAAQRDACCWAPHRSLRWSPLGAW